MVKLSLCLTNQTPLLEDVLGSTWNRPSPRVNLCHALGTTCNRPLPGCWTSLVRNSPSFPCAAAHLRRAPGRLRCCGTAHLHCLVNVEKLGVKEGELWLLVLVGEGSFHLRLQRCLASSEESGVAGFCSVMVEMSCYLGSYGPGSGRAGGSLCYSHVHHLQ
jgi:hypothetical protein